MTWLVCQKKNISYLPCSLNFVCLEHFGIICNLLMKHFNGSKTCTCKLLVFFQHCAPHIPHVPREHNTMYDTWLFVKMCDNSNPMKILTIFPLHLQSWYLGCLGFSDWGMLMKSSAMPVKAIKQYVRHYISLPYNQWVWNSEPVGVLLSESHLYLLPVGKGSTAWVSQFARLCSFWMVLGGNVCQEVGDASADREDFLPKSTERSGISLHIQLFFDFPESVGSAVLCVTTQIRQWLDLLIVSTGVKWQVGEMGSKSHAPRSVLCLFEKHLM